jgi:hypothetical protein
MCDDCRRDYDAERDPASRGYDADHRALRDEWQARMDAGETVHCHNPTCLRPGIPVDRMSWHLGHNPKREHRGPEHPACNLAEAGRASHTGL